MEYLIIIIHIFDFLLFIFYGYITFYKNDQLPAPASLKAQLVELLNVIRRRETKPLNLKWHELLLIPRVPSYSIDTPFVLWSISPSGEYEGSVLISKNISLLFVI